MPKVNRKAKKRRIVVLGVLAVLASILEVKKKRTVSEKDWLKSRNNQGHYENLCKELALTDTNTYRRCLRMDVNTLESSLEKVTPLPQRKNTTFKECICPGECLSKTPRYRKT